AIDPGVVAGEAEVAGGGRLHPVIGGDVDARGFLAGDVDRAEVDAGDYAVGVADHAGDGVLAGGRVDIDRCAVVGHAKPAVGLVAAQPLAVLGLHLVHHPDLVVVHRQVEAGQRRPHEAGRERLAGLHVQRHVAAVDIEGGDVVAAVVVAVVVAHTGLGGAAV